MQLYTIKEWPLNLRSIVQRELYTDYVIINKLSALEFYFINVRPMQQHLGITLRFLHDCEWDIT